VADGTVRLHGAPSAVRGFAHWFAWSPMAPAVREAAQAGPPRASRVVVSAARVVP